MSIIRNNKNIGITQIVETYGHRHLRRGEKAIAVVTIDYRKSFFSKLKGKLPAGVYPVPIAGVKDIPEGVRQISDCRVKWLYLWE